MPIEKPTTVLVRYLIISTIQGNNQNQAFNRINQARADPANLRGH